MSEFVPLSGIDQSVVDAWIRAKNQTQPGITEPAGGFPAPLLDSLRKADEKFDVDRALHFIRSGADMFARLPGIEVSTFDTDRDHIEVSRLTNSNMFTLLQFRANVDNRSRLRPHFPKKLAAVPSAGLLSVFDAEGNAVVKDREVNILEYATIGKMDQRQYDQFIGMLDKDSPQVKEGLNRALEALVSGIGVNKPLATGTQVLSAARTVMSLVIAGADPFSPPAGEYGDQERQPQLRMLRLLLGTLRQAKQNPSNTSNPGPTEAARIESVIETLLAPNPDTGALPFDIEYRDPRTGRTLLHCAVESDSTRAVEMLLHAGADVDGGLEAKLFRPHLTGSITPISIANEIGHDRVVAVLQAWKAKNAVAKAIGSMVRPRAPTAS